MIFFLDNFDVNFLHRLCVNRLCQLLLLLLLLLLYICEWLRFHVILLLLYYLHFGSDSQNQEITGKPHQINLY